ncbi:MAG: sodium ion-translocating decarboxylase subunit beta [Alphaproteobacteria bacterium]|nr:sodium ion-translocating decarboxylase subunit beta [Alphaproteobacteria bacterium]
MKKYPFFFWSALILFSLFLVIELSLYSTSVFSILDQTAISQLFKEATPAGMLLPIGFSRLIMIAICCLLFYFGICKKFEPLLLIPIAMGGLLANIPGAGLTQEGGLLYVLYNMGIENGIFPLLIFMGVGAMIDFSPLLANPKTALLGGAAQFAIFGTFLGAICLTGIFPELGLTLKQAASIAIIGGADGPTSIFLAGKLAPELLGAIAVAAYSYMALVPVIQPPVMRALTTKKERLIEMPQLRPVSKKERIIFPIMVVILTGLFVPLALPLIGMLMFGNLLKESGVTERLSKTAANELINIVTIMLGLSVGSKLSAEMFLVSKTLVVLLLGVCAFIVGTGSGVLMAKFMNLFLKNKINPLIGSAGVSAIPMASRVSEKLGVEANPQNHLLMQAMGANVAGAIGSAIAAGILLALC